MAGRRPRVTILIKLAAVIGTLVLAIVGFLGVYFPSRQLNAHSEALRARTEAYARLASVQLQSAIAFADKATARETFDSLSQDKDVQAIALYTDKGVVLESSGHLPDIEALKQNAKRESITEDRETVVLTAAPVVSLEGPRGVVVIALSKRSLAELSASVRDSSMFVGAGTLLLGLLVAWMIARAFARRLRAIADVASRVAGGDLDHPQVVDETRDEIGALATAFNAMLSQLRELFARIQTAAREEQARLAHLVAERTRDLDNRNRAMRLVLDNVGQGFLTLDADATVSAERSAILDRWFGAPENDRDFFQWISPGDQARASWYRVSFDAIFDSVLPIELALDQMVKEISSGESTFALEFRPIVEEGGAIHSVLVIVSDVTAERARARAEVDERETQQLFSRFVSDRAGFFEFLEESRRYVEKILALEMGQQLVRDIHTLKGVSALFRLETIPGLCHQLETEIAEGDEAKIRETSRRIGLRWQELETRLAPLLASADSSRVEIDRDTHRGLLEDLRAQRPHAELANEVEAWSFEPVKTRLARVAEQAKALAERLEKGPLEVRIEADQTRLDPAEWSNVWSVLSHVVRNAIDHGLETRAEREERGKPSEGVLLLSTRVHEDDLVVEIADSGRGVDWERLRQKAKRLGLDSSTTEDLVNAMFSDGVSTKDEASDVSGRGIGLAAVREECELRGGKIEVRSQPGQGTSFIFRWPARAAIQ